MEGKSMTPRRAYIFLFRSSQQLPILRFRPSPRALLAEIQKNKGTIRCVKLGMQVPGHH